MDRFGSLTPPDAFEAHVAVFDAYTIAVFDATALKAFDVQKAALDTVAKAFDPKAPTLDAQTVAVEMSTPLLRNRAALTSPAALRLLETMQFPPIRAVPVTSSV